MQPAACAAVFGGRNIFSLEQQKCPWHNQANLSRLRPLGALHASATQLADKAIPCHEKNKDL
jgi:hypothetical protein